MSPLPSLARLFWVFLSIGGTSIGGGVAGYLRSSVVDRHRWIDDEAFAELLSIGQTLPGLIAANMAILIGDRLRGARGAILAVIGICLPGAVLMTGAAFAYGAGAANPLSQAFLHAVSAGAVGLILTVLVQLGRRTVKAFADLLFAAGTAGLVAGFHMQVPLALIGVGALAIWWHRPRA